MGRVGCVEGFDPRHGVCRCRQLRDLVLDPGCRVAEIGRTQDIDNGEADVAAAHGEWIEHAGDTQCLASVGVLGLICTHGQ